MMSRLAYRSRQFWNALFGHRKRLTSESFLNYLTPAQQQLFQRMQPSEQAHAFQIFKSLETAGQVHPDVLAAALLHDVGKTLYPLSIFDRVLIVLGKRLFPRRAQRWAEGSPQGLRLPFVVAEHHAEWGAELAAQAGATCRAVELIRRHQEQHVPNPSLLTERLLAALQAADDEN
jgi:putative nucleotidyltransferase with HDIG domain